MTTNSEQQRAKAFAKESDKLADDAKLAIDAFLLMLLQKEDSDEGFAVEVAILAFLASFEELVLTGSRNLATFSIGQIPEFATVTPILPLTEQRLLIESVRVDLNRKLETLIIQQQQTGISANKSAPTQMMSARKVMEIRMALDAVAVRTAQKAVYDAGLETGIEKDKKAVAVIDNVTTDLCLNRMNGQVRSWQEYFVDPKTGAQWLYPPFIGSTLPKSEIFHFCRTMIIAV